MKINEFHHIGLKTADLDRSAAFYGALGAEETTRFKLPSTLPTRPNSLPLMFII